MLRLMSVELLKIRRSLALLMMFAIPLVVLVLNTLMMLKRTSLAAIGVQQWQGYWMGNSALWCYFMLPLYIALVTGLLNGQEHRNQTWRLMLTLPVSQAQLFMVKGVLAWLFIMGASAVLAGSELLVAAALVLAGAAPQGAFDYALVAMLGKVALSCLPVLAIQHALSWRFQNLVLPLAIGVIGTIGIVQIGSSSNWVWYPWSYPMMAVNGSAIANQNHALMLAALAGSTLFALSAWLLVRRDVAL